jgi:hypothetical protein
MSQETKLDNFGSWMYLNCPKEIRKEKHSEVVKYVFKRYSKEIKGLGLKSMTKKQLLNQIFLNKNLHKPVFFEPKKEPPIADFDKKRKRIISKAKGEIDLESFYLTDKWLALKRKVHKLYKCGCMKCGINGIETHVDHIFPRSTHPEFELSIHNLQILCKKCNLEKSNKNNIDYRTDEQKKMCSIKFN